MRIPMSAITLPLNWLAGLSLKTRVTAIVVGIVLASVASIAVSTLYVMNRDVKALIGQQQFLLISTVASALDQKFELRYAALQALADGSPDAAVQDHATWQAYVERRRALKTKAVFDNLSVFDAQGNLIANLNDTKVIGRFNAMKRPYMAETLNKRRGVISEPFLGVLTQKPIVVMTVPVLDDRGAVRVIFAATIDLSQQNFLGQFAETKIGNTGYMFILSPDGIVIEHPTRSRILQRSDAIGGRNVASERALRGFEGATEATNRVGVDSLYAFKRMQTTGWIVAAAYPKREALASVRKLEEQALLFALGLAVLGGVAAWSMTRRQIRPLDHLESTIGKIRRGETYEPYGRYRKDEIGRLGAAFEALMEERLGFEAQLRESEAKTRSILTHAVDAFVSIDAQGRITEWNPKAEATFGWHRAEVLGKDMAEVLIPPAMRQAHRHGMERFVSTGEGPVVDNRIEVKALHRDGREIPIELSVSAIHEGDHYAAHAFMHDISHRKAIEQALAENRERLQTVTDNMPALISYVDRDERYRFANRAYMDWHGTDPATMVGRTARDYLGEEMYAALAPHLRVALDGERTTFESAFPDGKGGTRHTSATYVPHRSESGEILGTYVMVMDITARKTLELQLHAQARQDALTGLPNRLEFGNRLEHAIARAGRLQKSLALLFLDLDGFKQINDAHGHAAGDMLLREVAIRIQTCVRKSDTVARLGGDEFIVLVESLEADGYGGEAVARKIIAAMTEPVRIGGREMVVTTSVGVAFWRDGQGMEGLLAEADTAMYAAKAKGKNCFYVAPDPSSPADTQAVLL